MPYNFKPGLGDAASYQQSGKPFVTGSLNATLGFAVTFPSVTRWVQIFNHDNLTAGLSCSFSANGLNNTNNYFVVECGAVGMGPGTSGRLELTCCQMFFSGSSNFDVVAGLTGIECGSNLPTNWSGTLGVG